ncbi:hypothetical protein [Paramagnetospirillum magneticum]|uniref:Uncharacterized protein n=1 Tax=Paramagnetospirillum magneticum (strain ATCC 700264 / AMB-1) TaxID=342108 RepID=Q2W760_PARM1|nr:hypothetical protein [Paramagnetospirillum magneticum]BAE50315.1 hypothetical protein amb1511 [Paramagnetospirillum magneticum AMB-1]
MIAIPARLNRDRRNVALAARMIVSVYRCLPPILWDWSERADRLKRRAEMVGDAAAMARAGGFRLWGWHAPRTVRALFRDPERRVFRHDD